ncbi:MAG: hypothetical protein ABI472_15465 [Ginsengibacter sp.]
MKKISSVFLVLSLGTTAYFFIKEQIKGVALSPNENILLSISYLITGISVLILVRIKFLENRNQ